MPGIFNRISALFRANVNGVIDSAEDPAKMLNQLIREMQDALRDTRAQISETIARERLLEADIANNREQSAEWDRRARLAMSQNAEDLARKALERKLSFQRVAAALETQAESLRLAVEKLKSDLVRLQDGYETFVQQRDQLVARYDVARTQGVINQTLRQYLDSEATGVLHRMEHRASLEEARAQAGADVRELSLAGQFATLEHDAELEEELRKLKSPIMGELPAPASADAPTERT
jgi:phage shock protein A